MSQFNKNESLELERKKLQEKVNALINNFEKLNKCQCLIRIDYDSSVKVEIGLSINIDDL